MSDTEGTETTDTAPAAEAETDSTAETATQAPETGAEGKEAAKYRRQLREVEKARDGLQERLTAHQRRDAERIASGHLADATDLWQSTDLDALLEDDGLVDETKVQAAVAAIV